MVCFISTMPTLQFSEHLIIFEPLTNKRDPGGKCQRPAESFNISGFVRGGIICSSWSIMRDLRRNGEPHLKTLFPELLHLRSQPFHFWQIKSLQRLQQRASAGACLFLKGWRIYLSMQETWVWSLDWKCMLEKDMVTHFSIVVWEIPRTEDLVGYSPWGCKRVGHNLVTKQTTKTDTNSWARKRNSFWWFKWREF